MKKELTAERLRELLHYDPATGQFHWRINRKGGARAGGLAGASHGESGYRVIGIDGAREFEHRLAWLYVHGSMPPHFIDHRNGNRSDNRMANLRPADDSQNQQMQAARCDSASGARGVYWHKQRQRWHAQITVDKKKRSLGLHDSIGEAVAARTAAQSILHPYASRNDA